MKILSILSKDDAEKDYSRDSEILPQKKVSRKKEHSFSSVKDLRATVYRGCTIGNGVFSTYISVTRDCNPDLQKPTVRLFIEQMLDEAAYIADMA